MFAHHRMRSLFGTAAVSTLLVIFAAGCGSDDADARPTTAEFCAEAQASDNGDDSGPYGEFYDLHPDPTLEDWAKDGHIVVENIQDGIDQMTALHPSDEAQPLMDGVLAAFAVLKKNAEDGIVAAEAGDQAAFDELEAVNQDTNVPALMEAFGALIGVCGATP